MITMMEKQQQQLQRQQQHHPNIPGRHQPGMSTVEQRVHARANLKLLQQQQQQQQQVQVEQRHEQVQQFKSSITQYNNVNINSNSNISSSSSNNPLDREWLVRLGDALWSHCSGILSRQRLLYQQTSSKSSSYNNNNIIIKRRRENDTPNENTTTTSSSSNSSRMKMTTQVCMTLQDVIGVLQNSSAATSSSQTSAVPTTTAPSTIMNSRVSKKKLVEAFRQLCILAPTWIRISDVQDDSIHRMSFNNKNTSIWIAPMEYQSIRSSLLSNDVGSSKSPLLANNRNELPITPPTITSSVTRPDQKRRVGLLNSLLYPQLGKKLKQEEHEKSNSSSSLSIDKDMLTGVGPKSSQTINSNNKTATDENTSYAGHLDTPAQHRDPVVQVGVGLSQSTNSNPKITANTINSTLKSSSVNISSRRRIGTTVIPSLSKVETTTTTVTCPRESELRINPKLILSDADYNGGEIISSTSQLTSPRGLKILFNRMNAGKRI
jgi:hypothetical protein